MSIDRLQTRRFEIKYQIDDRVAHSLRRLLRSRLEPDPFGASAELPVYPVHSLYLDTPDYSLCRATFHGDRNRFKLRVRYYDDDAASPVYLEVKRREDRCIRKQRALVRREAVAELLAGARPRSIHLAKPSDRALADLEVFCDLAARLRAGPSAHIAYEREAWAGLEQHGVRVTFDRAVRCEPVDGPRLETAFRRPAAVCPGQVILELKFTDRFPVWLAEVVALHSLQPVSAAKYADGLAISGAVRDRRGDAAPAGRVARGEFAGFLGIGA